MSSLPAVEAFESIKKIIKPNGLPIIVDLEDHLSEFQRSF